MHRHVSAGFVATEMFDGVNSEDQKRQLFESVGGHSQSQSSSGGLLSIAVKITDGMKGIFDLILMCLTPCPDLRVLRAFHMVIFSSRNGSCLGAPMFCSRLSAHRCLASQDVDTTQTEMHLDASWLLINEVIMQLHGRAARLCLCDASVACCSRTALPDT